MQLKAVAAEKKMEKIEKGQTDPTEKRGNLSQLFCIVRITTEKWCRHTPKTRKFLNPQSQPTPSFSRLPSIFYVIKRFLSWGNETGTDVRGEGEKWGIDLFVGSVGQKEFYIVAVVTTTNAKFWENAINKSFSKISLSR